MAGCLPAVSAPPESVPRVPTSPEFLAPPESEHSIPTPPESPLHESPALPESPLHESSALPESPPLHESPAPTESPIHESPAPRESSLLAHPFPTPSESPQVRTSFAPPESVHTLSYPRPTIEKLLAVAQKIGMEYDFSDLSTFILASSVRFQHSGTPLHIHNSQCSWNQHYAVLSFLLSGHLYTEYARLSGWLGLPPCSNTQWHRIVEKLEPCVTQLAEWSCDQVRQRIMERGDDRKWIASFDGFYLTRGHYSNNASATLHDFITNDIAWFTHRTKRGPGHNWEGTSAGAEGDMFDEVMKNVKDANFVVKEIITDKDSSTNAIFCRHFPEGTITYCSNHCAKTLHKDLEKIKRNKCEVSFMDIATS